MMPDFAVVEKFFAYMTLKASSAAGYSCRKQFSTRQILNAKFPHQMRSAGTSAGIFQTISVMPFPYASRTGSAHKI
jgi:hypothetical protein